MRRRRWPSPGRSLLAGGVGAALLIAPVAPAERAPDAVPAVAPAAAPTRHLGAAAGTVRAADAVRSCTPVAPHYVSRPDLHPAGTCVSFSARHVAPGLVFTTPNPTTNGQHGPTIYDNRGQVVWYRPMPYFRTWNLTVVPYRGQQMLAVYLQGRRGHRETPQVMLLNRHYHPVAHIRAGHGWSADLHEVQVTPDGHAWLGIYRRVSDPRTRIRVKEYVVQEIDIATGRVVFQWRSLDQVRPSESYKLRPPKARAWDYFHGNAIEPLPNGDILVSGRNTSAIYRISTTTGRVLWRLGGKRDDFGIVAHHPSWQFCFQHDVRAIGAHRISVFDNGGLADGNRCPVHTARAEAFSYDVAHHTAKRVRVVSSRVAVPSGRGLYTHKVGSARQLGNDDWIVSWGNQPQVTEVGAQGGVRWGLTLASYTYRAVRWPWVGDPTTRPALAARRSGTTIRAWASWNGATRVAAWQLVAGSSPQTLHAVGPRVAKRGFESRLGASTAARYVAVRAIDREGRVLQTSKAIRVR